MSNFVCFIFQRGRIFNFNTSRGVFFRKFRMLLAIAIRTICKSLVASKAIFDSIDGYIYT